MEQAADGQHPAAVAELVCWDSTSTLLISRVDELTARFRDHFDEWRDLEEYNREQSR